MIIPYEIILYSDNDILNMILNDNYIDNNILESYKYYSLLFCNYLFMKSNETYLNNIYKIIYYNEKQIISLLFIITTGRVVDFITIIISYYMFIYILCKKNINNGLFEIINNLNEYYKKIMEIIKNNPLYLFICEKIDKNIDMYIKNIKLFDFDLFNEKLIKKPYNEELLNKFTNFINLGNLINYIDNNDNDYNKLLIFKNDIEYNMNGSKINYLYRPIKNSLTLFISCISLFIYGYNQYDDKKIYIICYDSYKINLNSESSKYDTYNSYYKQLLENIHKLSSINYTSLSVKLNFDLKKEKKEDLSTSLVKLNEKKEEIKQKELKIEEIVEEDKKQDKYMNIIIDNSFNQTLQNRNIIHYMIIINDKIIEKRLAYYIVYIIFMNFSIFDIRKLFANKFNYAFDIIKNLFQDEKHKHIKTSYNYIINNVIKDKKDYFIKYKQYSEKAFIEKITKIITQPIWYKYYNNDDHNKEIEIKYTLYAYKILNSTPKNLFNDISNISFINEVIINLLKLVKDDYDKNLYTYIYLSIIKTKNTPDYKYYINESYNGDFKISKESGEVILNYFNFI